MDTSQIHFCCTKMGTPVFHFFFNWQKADNQRLVGFALETDHPMEHAAEKLARKHLDMIVVNSLSDPGAGFGFDTNKVTLIFADGRCPASFPLKTKAEVAADILNNIESLIE